MEAMLNPEHILSVHDQNTKLLIVDALFFSMETLHRKDGVPDDAGSCSSGHVVPGATGFIGSGVLPSIPSFPHLTLSILQEHQECDPSETMI